MEISADKLVPLLLRRTELKQAITPGEKTIMSMQEQMRKIWQHPSLSDDFAEKANLSLIARSEERVKMQQYLLQIGARPAMEWLMARETRGMVNALMAKCGLALLIGSVEQKENPMLEVDEDMVMSIQVHDVLGLVLPDLRSQADCHFGDSVSRTHLMRRRLGRSGTGTSTRSRFCLWRFASLLSTTRTRRSLSRGA